MKSFLIFSIVFSIPLIAQSELTQDSGKVFTMNEIFPAKGVILPSNIQYFGKDAKDKERFTPSIQEVKIAEWVTLNNLDIYDQNGSKLIIPSIDAIMNYFRQYFGYIESDGSKIIVIYYMNVMEQPILFKNWDNACSIGAGDDYYQNTHLVWIDITNKKRIFK